MAFAQIYSTAFAISIFTSSEQVIHLRRRRGVQDITFTKFSMVLYSLRVLFNDTMVLALHVRRSFSAYILSSTSRSRVPMIRSSLERKKSNAVAMFSRHWTVSVILSYLYITQAASFSTVPKHGSSPVSRDLQAIDGSTRNQNFTQRDGFRSVAYYVVSSTAIVLSANKSIDVTLELGDIRSQAQPTRLTSRKAHARLIRIRQCSPGNRGSVLDRS
jgi:hypothetical protein